MDSYTRDNLAPAATLSRVYMWKRRPCRPRQSWPCMIILYLYWIIKCTYNPLPLSFPRSFDHSGFCRVKFHFFENDFCFKGNLHSSSKRKFNCRKYCLISNFGWMPSDEESVSGKTGFAYHLYFFKISRAPPSWITWRHLVAQLFRARDALLPNNSLIAATKWRHKI